MRIPFVLAVALAAALAPAAAAQRGRRPPAARPQAPEPDARSGDDRFAPALRAGQRLDLSNIDGSITVTQTRGGAAEIVIHRGVHRGNGDLVKAVMQETSSGARVCVVYLNRDGDNDGCDRRSRGNDARRREPLDVEMRELRIHTVDGAIRLHRGRS